MPVAGSVTPAHSLSRTLGPRSKAPAGSVAPAHGLGGTLGPRAIVVAVARFYGYAMDIVFVWLFIGYGAIIAGPFMIPVVHASIDALKAFNRGLRRNLVGRPDVETLQPAAV